MTYKVKHSTGDRIFHNKVYYGLPVNPTKRCIRIILGQNKFLSSNINDYTS